MSASPSATSSMGFLLALLKPISIDACSLMGDYHYQKIARHFDHGVRFDGKLVLTKQGQKEFAKALHDYVVNGSPDANRDIRAARSFFARQVAKINSKLGGILGASQDAGYIASQLVKPPGDGVIVELVQDLFETKFSDKLTVGRPISEQASIDIGLRSPSKKALVFRYIS